MNHEAIEAQLQALVNEATPKAKDPREPAQAVTPQRIHNKATMAALIFGGAIFGALGMGLFQPDPMSPMPPDTGTMESPGEKLKIDSPPVNIDIGCLRK
ncbi:hypothetical protein [Desulfoluna spongiiphila]|uniref:hypothetical protein n=1 Tax=Desulfoluna spongiiphila TaxID=419481 RepID=UPI00125A482F|nr:hypothetical protein [Desulfoluna spongiiphila]VVS91039.1 consensus disorder prediction [Desulfoluna spongiiphila]